MSQTISKAAGRASPQKGRPGRNPAAILKSENGDVNYFSTVVFIFIAVLLLAFILDLFSIISTKQELDHCADQMVKQIQLSGGINGETQFAVRHPKQKSRSRDQDSGPGILIHRKH